MNGINFAAHLFSVICANTRELSLPLRNNIYSDILLFILLAVEAHVIALHRMLWKTQSL